MKLDNYNKKRNFNKTNEPKGIKKETNKKLKFVVQHHLARKDHYDFRLEHNGVLVSWAVPKGPSYNTKDKRLAVLVEDHPLDYRNFEGTIPKGEYGGGTVMIWDEGYYKIKGNFNKDFKKGSLKITLYGNRLKGDWTLIHFKENNWLLIKEKDNIKGFKNINNLKTSIKTGRTMKEIDKTIKKIDIEITNPDKIILENPKITKKDIVNYYKKVSNLMLPYLENRIISTIRRPDGKNNFFMKHLDNKYLGKIKVKNENNKKEDYYYIKDINGLISEVQMNSYEFHIWGSNIKHLEKPNMMVFDLDPDEHLSLKKLRDSGSKSITEIIIITPAEKPNE